MKISEINELSSLKYEYKGSIKHNKSPYVLKGLFYKINSGKSGKSSKFFGYFEGTRNFVDLQIVFTNTDVEETKRNIGFERNLVYMNINNVSGTRFKKEISDYLKKGCKQLRKVYDTNVEIERLQHQKNIAQNKYNTLESPTELIERTTVNKSDFLRYSTNDTSRIIENILTPLPKEKGDRIIWNDDDKLSPVGMYLEYDHSIHYNYLPNEKDNDRMYYYIEDSLENSPYRWKEHNSEQINYYKQVFRYYKELKQINKKLKSVDVGINFYVSAKGTNFDYYVTPRLSVNILKKNDNLLKDIEILEKIFN